ncbi:MAG: S8 family serine peptidase, partial [Phycisphaerales bacterium]
STAICSILFGEDPNAFYPDTGNFYYQGVAPKADAEIYEFWHFLTNNVFEQSPPDADIITIGVGYQFEDWWTSGIESLAEHYGLIVVAGIGNGTDAHDPVLNPGAGANIIGVGVVDSVNTEDPISNLTHFALAYPEHSSSGPTNDERCKPDIVAPANCLAANDNEPNAYEPTGNFSSFSTPIVAGTIGLLVQKAKQDPNLSPALSPDGGNCLIKSILLNSAIKLPYWHKGRLQIDDDHTTPLDYIQGAGMLNAVGAYQQLIAGPMKPGEVLTAGWDLNQLDQVQITENIYKITLAEPADKIISTTAVWNKHYNNIYPFEPEPQKDSNLRLELWVVDPGNPSNDYLLDYSDSTIDNVEHIHTPADPNYNNYEIILSFSEMDNHTEMTPIQNYALTWNISDKQDNNSIFWYDLNADGIVDELDFTILLTNILNSKKSQRNYLLGDINADGIIDISDFKLFFEHNNRQADWYTKLEDSSL